MNPKEYVDLLKKNILRLKSDGDYLFKDNRNLMAIFCYITCIEEFFKLMSYLETNKLQPDKRHFIKLIPINELITDKIHALSAKLKSDDVTQSFITTITDDLEILINNTGDPHQKTMLQRQKEKLLDERIIIEIKQATESQVKQFPKDLERFYSDRARNNCLYVDWNHSELTEHETALLLALYGDIATAAVSELNPKA